jgi:hypothetical protein
MIAGIDYSTRAVDVVLLDEDSDAATWHRFELKALGKLDDAFERTRSVRDAMPARTSGFWDDVSAIGIEQARGHDAYTGMRVQGAILACIPRHKQVEPHNPSEWRKTVGLPGNASKDDVARWANAHWLQPLDAPRILPQQDAYDAFCIALATRTLLERVPA